MGVQLQRLPRAGLCPVSDRGHIVCPCLAPAWHQHRVLNASPIPRLSTTKERETSKQLLLIRFRKPSPAEQLEMNLTEQTSAEILQWGWGSSVGTAQMGRAGGAVALPQGSSSLPGNSNRINPLIRLGRSSWCLCRVVDPLVGYLGLS